MSLAAVAILAVLLSRNDAVVDSIAAVSDLPQGSW
jgi:hypothetical protein